MFRNERLEMKVGLFIGAGIFIMFLIVFSISDLYLLERGYNVNVIFDFVNGINEDSPVRLAGVHVGEVKKIELYYDKEAKKTRVKLDVRVNSPNIQVETDAVARINTLGLLGEQYLELTPGTSDRFIKPGETMVGKNPINVSVQMEMMSELARSVSEVFDHVKEGEGTLGKLLMDDTLYNDLAIIFGRLKDGEGTLGKLLVSEKVYDDLEGFVSDIKAHPWKLLKKTTDRKKTSDKDESRGSNVSPR